MILRPLHVIVLNEIMRKERQNKSEKNCRLYIVHPTLDVLLNSCDNVKQIAYECGMDHSNFIKLCKLGTDFRISTYVKCANAFGLSTLILHLPAEMIDPSVNTKEHLSNRCHVIEEKDLFEILHGIYSCDSKSMSPHLELWVRRIKEEIQKPDIRTICDVLIDLCQNIKESYGNE